VRLLFLLLILSITGCTSLRWPDSVGVSIDDMEGVGTPEIDECQITFGGEVPAVPCEIQLEIEWEL
jgi:hypothetical protein